MKAVWLLSEVTEEGLVADLDRDLIGLKWRRSLIAAGVLHLRTVLFHPSEEV